jgi:pimeloyl-ACP methyl ester carboxylesterase
LHSHPITVTDASLLAEVDAAVDRLLPRSGVPVARRLVALADGRAHVLEAGDGPPVVLLHGGFGGAGNWYRTIGPLSRRYRVLALDRPGYGLTPGPAPDPVAWLGACLAALDAPRAALMGHASGGALALAYAQVHPAAVTALVVTDMPLLPPADQQSSPPAGRRAARDSLQSRPTIGGLAGPSSAPTRPPPRPRRVETWYASLAARFDDRRLLAPEYLYYLWCLARLRPEQDQRPPGEIAPGPVAIPGPGERTWPARPSLLVWGHGNRGTGALLARQLHQRIPDAWLRVIGRSKGIPNLEQPGEFNYAIMTFLAAVLHEG